MSSGREVSLNFSNVVYIKLALYMVDLYNQFGIAGMIPTFALQSAPESSVMPPTSPCKSPHWSLVTSLPFDSHNLYSLRKLFSLHWRHTRSAGIISSNTKALCTEKLLRCGVGDVGCVETGSYFLKLVPNFSWSESMWQAPLRHHPAGALMIFALFRILQYTCV